MYGSKIQADGTTLTADGKAPIMTGECVKGNIISGLNMATDQNGNAVENRAVLSFKQPNGATFNHSIMEGTLDWQLKQTNKDMLHICTKIVSEEDYYAIVAEHGDGSFQGWIKAIAKHIIPKAEGKTYSLKIVYKENKNSGDWHPNFPKFPNFIALDDTVPYKFGTNPKFDFYVIPASTPMSAGTTPETSPDLTF